MLKLETLTFNNIRCFDSEQTVDFINRNKLVQVDGRNENTGGSSGAGKTTVFLALDYLLGINDIPATVLQSRLTKDSIAVSGIFDIDGKKAEISRSKKNGLTIKYNEETVSGNVKMAEEKLDELLGVPRKIFRKMVHKKQKEGGFFLDMTAKEIYEFLISMLGLSDYLSKVDLIGSKTKDYTKEIENTINKINTEETVIESLTNTIDNKVKPQCTLNIGDLEKVELGISQYESQIMNLKTQRTQEIDKIKKPEKTEIPFDDSEIIKLNTQIEVIQAKLNQANTAKVDLNGKLRSIGAYKEKAKSLGQKIGELKKEKQKMEHESICPTCKREWVGKSAEERISAIQGDIEKNTKEVLGLKDLLAMEPEHKYKIERLDNIIQDNTNQKEVLVGLVLQETLKQQNHTKTQEDAYNGLLNQYNIEVAKIKAKFEGPIEDTKLKWDAARNQYNQWSFELNSHNKNLKSYEEEIAKIAQDIDAKKTSIKALNAQKQDLEKKLVIAEEVKRLIKTYVLQTFQETLDLIGDMATDILSAIPNMSSSTIYFEGCKENKSGGIKDEVTAVINMDGNNKVPIKSLSGGERTAIDLAVDLAVIDIIESKTGKGADFYVIDEPFDGLDSVCKENCLEILKQVDTNKKIIMVDHSSELKEMVSDIITVVKNGESSAVVS